MVPGFDPSDFDANGDFTADAIATGRHHHYTRHSQGYYDANSIGYYDDNGNWHSGVPPSRNASQSPSQTADSIYGQRETTTTTKEPLTIAEAAVEGITNIFE